MAYSEQLICNNIDYLIDKINVLLMKNNSSSFVEAKSEITYPKDESRMMRIAFNYILNTKTSQKTILTSAVRVDADFYFLNEEQVLEDLNEAFYIEILLHTEFSPTKKVNSDVQNFFNNNPN